MLQSTIESAYRPVGFIVDQKDKSNHNLLGLSIYAINKDLITMMKQKDIKCVIVSPIKMQEINPIKDLSIFINNGIQILTTPYFTDFSETDSENNIAEKTPFVSVPVLSRRIVSAFASKSRYLPPLTRIPAFDAPPIPPK